MHSHTWAPRISANSCSYNSVVHILAVSRVSASTCAIWGGAPVPCTVQCVRVQDLPTGQSRGTLEVFLEHTAWAEWYLPSCPQLLGPLAAMVLVVAALIVVVVLVLLICGLGGPARSGQIMMVMPVEVVVLIDMMLHGTLVLLRLVVVVDVVLVVL